MNLSNDFIIFIKKYPCLTPYLLDFCYINDVLINHNTYCHPLLGGGTSACITLYMWKWSSLVLLMTYSMHDMGSNSFLFHMGEKYCGHQGHNI